MAEISTKPNKNNSIQLADFRKKFKNIKISLTVYNVHIDKTYHLLSNANNADSCYKIIYDPEIQTDLHLRTHNYYCNSPEELDTMIMFICNHPDIYTYHKSEDVLDQEDTISLNNKFDKIAKEVNKTLY